MMCGVCVTWQLYMYCMILSFSIWPLIEGGWVYCFSSAMSSTLYVYMEPTCTCTCTISAYCPPCNICTMQNCMLSHCFVARLNMLLVQYTCTVHVSCPPTLPPSLLPFLPPSLPPSLLPSLPLSSPPSLLPSLPDNCSRYRSDQFHIYNPETQCRSNWPRTALLCAGSCGNGKCCRGVFFREPEPRRPDITFEFECPHNPGRPFIEQYRPPRYCECRDCNADYDELEFMKPPWKVIY